MTLVLDTVAPTTLTAVYDDTAKIQWTVEATIKSVSRMSADALRDLAAYAERTGNRKAAFVVRHAVALQAEVAQAHAEALEVAPTLAPTAPATVPCDGCPGDGVFRYAGVFENGVWRGKTGQCFRCGGKGTQTPADEARNRYYDNQVRRVYA